MTNSPPVFQPKQEEMLDLFPARAFSDSSAHYINNKRVFAVEAVI